MEVELQRELDDLRAENRILRDSMTEVLPARREGAKGAFEKTLGGLVGFFDPSKGPAKGPAKAGASPALGKLAGYLGSLLEKNPAPVLLAALGAGFLMSKSLRKKQ